MYEIFHYSNHEALTGNTAQKEETPFGFDVREAQEALQALISLSRSHFIPPENYRPTRVKSDETPGSCTSLVHFNIHQVTHNIFSTFACQRHCTRDDRN